MAGMEGIEPSVLVLETSGLPLTDTPKWESRENGLVDGLGVFFQW